MVSLVGPSGGAYRVIHKGVKFIDKGEPQAMSSIPPGAVLRDVILPSESIIWGRDGWEAVSMLPDPNIIRWKASRSEECEKYKAYFLSLKDKKVKLFMPLRWGTQEKLYEFTFVIQGIEPPLSPSSKRRLFGGGE